MSLISSDIQAALEKIPRLKRVLEITGMIDQNYSSTPNQNKEVVTLASIIRIAKNYDEAASLGHARPVIFEWLLKNRNSYLPEGLEA